ncbi:Mitochondrial-processing peptidase subunit alpha [Hypsibius exemplaris]|uniref:Mitochondrial-processing peptidase subunit alpha n=1 Tax=Hypsibius exemplaris TaxID=2072580 RepID=A0A1W0WEX0_HYPEX|nr:Mitochondrial-processing peptidase subunit alpha [Hypsibius exemplaris]
MFRLGRSLNLRSCFRRFGTKTAPAESSSSSINGGKKSPTEIPLSQPLPDFPPPLYASVSERDQQETKVTRLANGIRVASQPKFGQFCTIGMLIDSGSRYEVAYPSGISHFLEKLAFQSTKNFTSRDAIMQYLEKYGGICDAQISRDSAVYASSVESQGYDAVVKLLNDISRQMLISEKELVEVRQAVKFDLEDLAKRYEQDSLLTEMIHKAAYRENTLGLPRLCPPENVDKIDRKTLFSYLSQYYTPSRMVIAGVGIDHGALIESTEKYFCSSKAVWEEDPSLVLPSASKLPADASVAQYTGGEVRIEKDLSSAALGPSTIPELAHFALGFQSSSHVDEDFVPFCVLNILMGGGGSFSAGGPGKGMYTRLYTNALNKHHYLYSATAFNHSYIDSGLFCILASSPPESVAEMVATVVEQFQQMAGPVGEEELNRAKTQLSSMLMMQLESRPVIFEDIGRQVLAYGHRKTAKTLLEQIDSVTAEDIQRVAERMLRTKPSVACLGKLSAFPSYSDIQGMFTSVEPQKKKRFSLFL